MAGSRFFQVALVHFAGESAGYSLDTIIRETDALLFRDSRNDSFVFDMDGKMCIVFADSDIDRSARLLKESCGSFAFKSPAADGNSCRAESRRYRIHRQFICRCRQAAG